MAEQQHTPGLWTVIPSPHGEKYLCVQIGEDDLYATMEMLPADAYLTAAAPDLLVACTALADYAGLADEMTEEDAEAEGETYARLFRLYRAAVRKARGEDA